MRDWIILILLMVIMGWIGFHYAHFIVEGINYVATWGQGLVLTESVIPPIPPLPDWVNIVMGVIAALALEEIYTKIRFAIKKRLFRRRSHSKEVE